MNTELFQSAIKWLQDTPQQFSPSVYIYAQAEHQYSLTGFFLTHNEFTIRDNTWRDKSGVVVDPLSTVSALADIEEKELYYLEFLYFVEPPTKAVTAGIMVAALSAFIKIPQFQRGQPTCPVSFSGLPPASAELAFFSWLKNWILDHSSVSPQEVIPIYDILAYC